MCELGPVGTWWTDLKSVSNLSPDLFPGQTWCDPGGFHTPAFLRPGTSARQSAFPCTQSAISQLPESENGCWTTHSTNIFSNENSEFHHPRGDGPVSRLPYVCALCGKRFTFKEHYEGHVNVHNNVKAYKCPYCPKEYAYKTSLRLHVNRSCNKKPKETNWTIYSIMSMLAVHI